MFIMILHAGIFLSVNINSVAQLLFSSSDDFSNQLCLIFLPT